MKKRNKMNCRMHSRTLCSLALAAVCAASLALTGCSASTSDAGTGGTVVRVNAAQTADTAQAASPSDTVTVTSKGSVYAVPDLAELRFGVRTQAETAAEAQSANSSGVASVIKALKDKGVSEDNIQTTWYDVSPQYDWNTGNGDTITGYSVSTSLSVKGVAIKEAGSLISACTEAGANEFNGVSYSCSQYAAIYSEAQQKAVEASKEKASVLAAAAGRSLGPVRSITEGWQDTTYEANMKTMAAMDAGKGAGPESSTAGFMPGEAEITANVTVTYELK